MQAKTSGEKKRAPDRSENLFFFFSACFLRGSLASISPVFSPPFRPVFGGFCGQNRLDSVQGPGGRFHEWS